MSWEKRFDELCAFKAQNGLAGKDCYTIRVA